MRFFEGAKTQTEVDPAAGSPKLGALPSPRGFGVPPNRRSQAFCCAALVFRGVEQLVLGRMLPRDVRTLTF